MGLSRLDNFLKSTRGTILYVDPNSLDATDSIENQGNSLTRPFKTIQRALVESARFSYQRGKGNDRFGKTTIVLYPGDHIVDNRPGWIPIDGSVFKLRSGEESTDFLDWDLNTNFDLTSDNNVLYKLNSVHGGVILPRGTSIVGMDLRKTKIRPTYIPNPDNDSIESSCIFRLTGACYLYQFTILDANPNGNCYKDYTRSLFTPAFSHHKLRAFEYADGVNEVKINDDFIGGFNAGRTDLDMYYEKVGLVYGSTSGREISNDYPPSSDVDIQPTVDEYRIVGPRGGESRIASIISGDGITSSTTITVTLESPLEGLNVDTAIQIEGVSSIGYDGQYVVNSVISSTQFQYKVQDVPTNPVGGSTSAIVRLTVDTVSSASPYIFNCSLRTVYGMCGLLADGDKADGFKSIVIAQFTAIGLQKDDNAFTRYDKSEGIYKYSNSNLTNLYADSLAKYRPEYESYHIKAINDAYLQIVSVFSIGYAKHFVTENGGDMSINNSNSNFGAKALVASGFKRNAFLRDDTGYITHIISPQEIESQVKPIEFISIDVEQTVGVASTNRLYLYNYTDINNSPESVIDGYRIGARSNDYLNLNLLESGISSTYSARIIMPSTEYTNQETSFEKLFEVQRINVNEIENNIVDKILTFTTPHTLLLGESVRVISDNGHLPDGITPDKVYYAITNELAGVGIGSTQIKLAQTLSDAFRDEAISPNVKGGVLTVVSRVSDKISGDIGHPIQWDLSNEQWYINVSTGEFENTIYPKIVGVGTVALGYATPRTYVERKSDPRGLSDKIYKLRYVVPRTSAISGRPPLDSFVIQESSSGIGTGSDEIAKYFDPTNTATLSNVNELRNPRFIATCAWSASSGITTITTELPHDLQIGSEIKIINVVSTTNTTGEDNLGFNGIFTVSGTPSSKQFNYNLDINPGSFSNNTSVRDSSLPRFVRKKLKGTYQVYRSQEIKEYIPNVQDGIYHLIVTNSSNSPTVTPFQDLRFSQPIQNLYPQENRDNPVSDPESAKSYATSDLIGRVLINDPQKSITKETLEGFISDFNVGFGVTNIVSNSAGTAHTIYTNIDHGLSAVSGVSIVSGGSTYVTGTYYNVPLVGYAGSTTGQYATARVTVSSAGTISNVAIMDGGSAYGIGNTLAIKSIPRNFGSIDAVVRVNNTLNNIGDCISVSGISESYNTLYKISNISTGNSKQIEVTSSTVVLDPSTTGLGITATENATVTLVGNTLGITTSSYDSLTGISTLVFASAHGLKVNDKIRIAGAGSSGFNGDFIIKKTPGTVAVASTQITIDLGIKSNSIVTGGDIVVYPYGASSYGGNLTRENENTSSRLISQYDGVTTISTSFIDISATDEDPLQIQNAVQLGFKLGDYIQIDNEIFRIKEAVTSSSVRCFRAVLGTQRQSHADNSVIRKIKVLPIEFRRNSIIRASGHTFEYMGFGPGNYSTALPERQNRIISGQEELLTQATKIDGGVSIFTGMNSDGDFYTGNKKINSNTGQEEIFDAPIPTVTGEDLGTNIVNVGFDVLTPLEISVNRSIRVEGGETGNLISEFDGPVIFNNKITSTSSKGVEVSSLYLQGDAPVSRNITVGISTPINAGNPGDTVINAFPQSGNFYGWIYTTNNRWEKFGIIGENGKSPANRIGVSVDGNYVGISTLIDFKVSDNVNLTATNNDNVGITTVNFEVINQIGVSRDNLNNFVGLATQINFVGVGITVYSDYDTTSGIATITFDGLSLSELPGIAPPGGSINQLQYNLNGVLFGGISGSSYNSTTGQITFASSVNLNYSDSTALTVTAAGSNSAVRITQTGTGNALLIEDEANDASPFVISNSGSIGIGISVPQAKLDLQVVNEPALRIRSTSSSGLDNIVRIDSVTNDITPFIIDVNGSVGINTITVLSGIALDVNGNASVTGEIRFYNSARSNYTGFKSPTTLTSNLIWTLPNVAGVAGSVMYSVSPGVLGWSSVRDLLNLATTDDLPEGNTNKYFTNNRVARAIASEIGQSCGIIIEYNEITDKVDYKVILTSDANAYLPPFTTRGFSLPI
jgi:hypothetical protein